MKQSFSAARRESTKPIQKGFPVDRADIYAKVVNIVAHILKISKESIHEQSNLESLGADSLNRVEFIMELEEAFSIEINDEEAEKLSTVGETVDYVTRMVAAPQK